MAGDADGQMPKRAPVKRFSLFWGGIRPVSTDDPKNILFARSAEQTGDLPKNRGFPLPRPILRHLKNSGVGQLHPSPASACTDAHRWRLRRRSAWMSKIWRSSQRLGRVPRGCLCRENRGSSLPTRMTDKEWF